MRSIEGRNRVSRTPEFDMKVFPFEPLAPLFRLGRLGGILDGIELLELDIVKLAVDALDPPDIDGLDDVAGVRVDRDRPARAFPGHALPGGEQGGALGVA